MRRTPTDGDPQRRRIQQDLVHVLERTPLVRDENSRQLLLDELSDRVGELPVRQHPTVRLQVAELVRACAARVDAIAELVAVVAYLDPHTPQLATLLLLRDEWEATELLSTEDWTGLRPALEAASVPNLAQLCQQATRHRLSGPPSWCTNTWHIFVHLAGWNAGADGVPPHMVFLALLESQVDSQVAALIKSRNQRQATEYELTTALERRRAEIESGAESPTHSTAYLVVQIEPDLEPKESDPESGESYRVSHLRQWRGPDAWHSQQGADRVVRYAELEREVERIIDQMETEWSDFSGTVAVEFVLPWELLNADVEWWHTESESSTPTALAMDYPIVIRSLERLRTRRWHRRWHERWQRLQTRPSSSTVQISQPNGEDYFTRLENGLKSDDSVVSLVLSEPPNGDSKTGRQEIEAALRAGLPVVIWHRRDCTDAEFREAVNQMTSDAGLAELPLRAKELRRAALDLEPELRRDHVGRHLTVLWDDPERKPGPLGYSTGQATGENR